MTTETGNFPLDNGGQGWFHAVMANQTLSGGEPPIPVNGELPRLEAIGEPLPPNWRASSQLYAGQAIGPFNVAPLADGRYGVHTALGVVAASDTSAEAVTLMTELAKRYRVRTAKDNICYFIGSKGGPIKIGYARDVQKRLRALQTAHPFKLEVLATAEGGQMTETHYHGKFHAYRLEGEWFMPCQAIRAEIRRLNKRANASPALTTTNKERSHG